LTEDQDILTGSLEKQTFHTHEFGTRVTRNYLAGLFADKFQGKKKEVYNIRKNGKKHRITKYRFDKDVIEVLTKKYNITNGNSDSEFDSSGRSGGSGLPEDKADHVDHVDHLQNVKQSEQIKRDLDPTKPYSQMKLEDSASISPPQEQKASKDYSDD